MIREETVFGPIRSRRLGNSLGVNLLPRRGKLCNFDCIYCECGLNAEGREDRVLPARAEVRGALEDALSRCLLEGTAIDSITFSGDGEPTLNPDFPGIVDDAISLRDAFFPGTKLSVLSNATTLGNDRVFKALSKIDNPILKLDAPTNPLCRIINRPEGKFSVEEVIENMKRFDGDFILQTIFLKGAGFDPASPQVLGAWMDIVRYLKPRLTMVYTLNRPAPVAGLEKLSEKEMRDMCSPLIQEGYKIQING